MQVELQNLVLLQCNNIFLGTSTALREPLPYEYKWEDATGRGRLVAVDSLFITNFSASTAATNQWDVHIAYKFVDVSLEEWIGIIMSDQ